MKRLLVLFLLICASRAMYAQYGSAPNGYYPSGYHGDIFTGKITAVDQATQMITITHENKNKADTFTGRLQKPCDVPSRDGKPMTALDLPVGADVTAYFETKTHKEADKKVQENFIIGLMFHSWDGHPVKQESKKMYQCF